MSAEQFLSGVSLANLYAHRDFAHADDVLVSSCCKDHTRCRPGDLYVAIMEADFDGHEFAQSAVDRGANAILTERLLPVQIPQCIVPDTRKALGELCQRLAGSPGNDIPVLGIAGTTGISPTSQLITRLFDSRGDSPARFGIFDYSDGIEVVPRSSLRTSPPQFAQWLANVVTNGCTQAITELAQPGIANGVFSGVPIQCLVLTGFASETHRQQLSPANEAYIRRALSLVKPDGFVVANIDCPVVQAYVPNIERPVLTVSTQGNADVTATSVEQFPSEQTILLNVGNDTAVLRTRIVGQPHRQHCVLATAVGLGMGFELESIIHGVESVEQIPGNLERIECGQSFSVFVDAASTPTELSQTLRTLRSVTRGRLISMIGQGDQPRATRSQRGRAAEKNSDISVITSDDPNDQEPLKAAHDVLDGYHDVARPHVIPNRIRAIQFALSQARAGDTVLLAGPHNAKLTTEPDAMDLNSNELFPDSLIAKYCLHEVSKPILRRDD